MKKGILCAGLALGAFLASPVVMTGCGKQPEEVQPAQIKAEVTTENFKFKQIAGKNEYELVSRAVAGQTGNIVVPDTVDGFPVTKIGDWAFCQYFETKQDGTLGFHNSAVDNEVRYLMGDSSLTSVTLGKHVKELGTCAFANSGITTLNIPNSLNIIGDHTFYCCENLETINFENNSTLSYIDLSAFSGCDKLNNVVLPASVERIEGTAFLNCLSLTNFSFAPNSTIKYIGSRTFMNTAIVNITIPASVEEIGPAVFSIHNYTDRENYPSKLETVTFETGSNLHTLGQLAFHTCKELKSINLEVCTKLKTIGEATFYETVSLESITIPASVETIGQNCFVSTTDATDPNNTIYNSNLKSVTFETNSKLKEVSYGMFRNCAKLTSVNLNACTQLRTISSQSFRDCKSLTSIYIPASVIKMGGENSTIFYNTGLTSVVVENLNSYLNIDFDEFNYVNPINEGKNLYIGSVDANNLVKSITAEDFGNSVTKIVDFMFWNCSSIENIELPSQVKSLGINSFASCSNLAVVTFDGNSQLETIGNYAFKGCSDLTAFTIKSTVSNIGYSVFASSGLNALTFEDTISSWSGTDYTGTGDPVVATPYTESTSNYLYLNSQILRSKGYYYWVKNISQE